MLIAENANPEWVSVPLVGWSLARAIRKRLDAHVVTQIRCKGAIERAGWIHGQDFTAIDSEKIAAKLWKISSFLRGGKGVAWTIATAQSAFANYYFEHLVWNHFKDRLRRKEFDVVHRIIPLSPTAPSLLATRLAKIDVPYVLGPWNGGLPWPKEFRKEQHAEREWLSHIRGMYKIMPAYRSTRSKASAIIVGSEATKQQIERKYWDKLIYIPENGIELSQFCNIHNRNYSLPIKVLFVGRLVPYKGADMLIAALKPYLQSGQIRLTIAGDGPLKSALDQIVQREQIQGVSFPGWVQHKDIPALFADHHVFGFPSIREFGGGVILEAMAMGCVPVTVKYGGVGELCTSDVGYGVPLGSRESIEKALAQIFANIITNPQHLQRLSESGIRKIAESFTWDRKAEQIIEIYRWLLGQRVKPSFDFGNGLEK